VKVLYFAWLKERLNRAEEEVDPPAEVRTVADLIGWLRGRDELADAAMSNPKIIRAALDARIVPPETAIAGASVIALFPPMTGG
jgi:sulfur-carrier protein